MEALKHRAGHLRKGIFRLTEVSSHIVNSSAIPAWSGSVYQGKVALYHAIRLLTQEDPEADYLNVEHLDDFVIHDRSGQNGKYLPFN